MRRCRVLLAPLGLALLPLAGCGERGDTAPPALDVRTVLSFGDVAGMQRAVAPADLRFPRDHGPHPGFRTEWWYWTANVATPTGRAFGLQLVFFRVALAPPGAPARAASLAADQVVLAHAALTDVDGGSFSFAERMSRSDGLRAGLRGGVEALHLFCGDWSATAQPHGDGFSPLRLRAAGDGFAFELEVALQKPIVLQGDAGLSQKGREPGNASFYYSATRLQAQGSVTARGERHEVRGTAWCDREWSTSALDRDQVGWDWFALQLDDGSELMWYQLRRADGGEDAHSQGLFVHADGRSERLLASDVAAAARGEWQAEDGRARYPAAWRLTVPRLELELEVEPRLPDQELRARVRYWEGAVAVRGRRGTSALTGVGYLEMTGYAR
jgi:predicted secreted hydrolase